MRRQNWLFVPAVIVVSAQSGYAIQYLSLEQAQKELFSEADQFQALPVELSPDQKTAIQAASKVTVRNNKLNVWTVLKDQMVIGTFWVDQVVGKHEFITYALALNVDGTIRQVEIMGYREAYGYQVREANWRKQFVGKKASDPVILGRDIQNISGATLSCRNVTDGVKRILATNEIVLKDKRRK